MPQFEQSTHIVVQKQHRKYLDYFQCSCYSFVYKVDFFIFIFFFYR
jgi:hypothetical protein